MLPPSSGFLAIVAVACFFTATLTSLIGLLLEGSCRKQQCPSDALGIIFGRGDGSVLVCQSEATGNLVESFMVVCAPDDAFQNSADLYAIASWSAAAGGVFMVLSTVALACTCVKKKKTAVTPDAQPPKQ